MTLTGCQNRLQSSSEKDTAVKVYHSHWIHPKGQQLRKRTARKLIQEEWKSRLPPPLLWPPIPLHVVAAVGWFTIEDSQGEDG